MGNIDSRSKFDGGYLYLKTDQPYYYPGQMCTGSIFIRADREINGKDIKIKIKGKEKASFWLRHQSDDHSYMVKHGNSQKIIEHESTIWQWNQPIGMGDYSIAFSFKIPEGLPSSLMIRRRDLEAKPKAVIQYTIKAVMDTHGEGKLKYKQIMVIHQPPVPFIADQYQKTTMPIKTCCCIEHGQGTLEAKFDKNVFYANETAHAVVRVDNSQVDIAVEEVEFQVTQTLRLRDGDINGFLSNEYTNTEDIIEQKDRTGIPAKAQELYVNSNMSIDLNSITYEIPESRAKKNKARAPEHIFMMSGIPPACNSKYIDNNYVLNCNVKYAGCTCCTNLPSLSTPLTIIPMVYTASYNQTGPEGWLPQQIGAVEIEVTNQYV